MKKIFDRTVINGMELANRFVRSATYEGMAADDGAVTPKLIETMTKLAKGGVGLIISSHAYVRPDGQAGPWQLGVYKDELIPGLRDMTHAVHENGGKIIMQLSHAGKFAFRQDSPISPDLADIPELVSAFTYAALRAKAAGFDGVQIHCAHGYLLSQFLTPAFNQRQDQYGSSIENRTRISVEIIQAVREAVGSEYPIIIKLNSQDFMENGLSFEDSLAAGRILAAAGIDAIELSGGLPMAKLTPSRVGTKTEADEAYYQNEARALKELIDIPIILVGGMRSFNIAEKLVESETADYISMSRPLIREPELINRWKSGDLRPALCLSDNLCFKTAVSGNGVSCAVDAMKEE